MPNPAPAKAPAARSLPRLAAGMPVADVDELLRQAEDAEQDFDYELAASLWLSAAAAARGGQAAEIVAGCAEFLVDRAGQFERAAAWLDDALFVPADVRSPAAKRLWAALGRAAHATDHPRAEEIDTALAATGDAGATYRLAARLAAAGQDGRALALLEGVRSALPADGAKLLDRLRQQRQRATAAALQPLAAAVEARDVSAALLIAGHLQATWAKNAQFAALQDKLAALQLAEQAAARRQALETALDGGDLDGALAHAQALVAMAGATDADRRWLKHVAALRQARQLAEWIDAARAGDPLQSAAAVAAIAAEHHAAKVPFEAAGDPLHGLWQAALEAAPLCKQHSLIQRAAPLLALAELRRLVAGEPEDSWQSLLDRLPAEWKTAPTAAKAAAKLQADRQMRERHEEQGFVEAVRHLMDAEQWEDAAASLHAWSANQRAATPAIKALRNELGAAKLADQRKRELHDLFAAALARRDWLGARAPLGELQAHLPPGQWDALQDRWTAESRADLQAQMMPPGLQKLDPAQGFCAGVVGGRLLLVQGDVWFCVVLANMGLQPYKLPKSAAIDDPAAARLAGIGDTARLVGRSGAALVAIDQPLGGPPAVQAISALPAALKTDNLLLGCSLSPAAAKLALLSGSDAGGAQHWRPIDSATLQPLQPRRAHTPLLSLSDVAGAAHWHLATSTPAARRKGAWALAVLDGDGEPVRRWSAADVSHDLDLGHVVRACAWPDQDRIFASFATIDPFAPDRITQAPSLLVLRGDRVLFCSADLRRRFFPLQRLHVDHAWTLDTASGRLWFAALPQDEPQGDALLLGVDAKTLRADDPLPLPGIARILALLAVSDGVMAVCRSHDGQWRLVRAVADADGLAVNQQRLPL